ncbi:MAG: dihydroneopterin aldolase [Chloroflexi bacterium]|nr:dihydroneopterin aldolase [Chloroflexota bacterium]
MKTQLDRILLHDLRVRGILGIHPHERSHPQDILINVTLWADTRPAAASDQIVDAVNYQTIAEAIVTHIERGAPALVERLVAEIAGICFRLDAKVQAVEVQAEKPQAVPDARGVGVCIYRTRAQWEA